MTRTTPTTITTTTTTPSCNAPLPSHPQRDFPFADLDYSERCSLIRPGETMPSFNPSAPYFSERLQMRPPVMADLERFYAIFGDPQTNASTPPARSPAKRRPLRRCRSGSPSGGNTATAHGRSPCANGRIGLSVLAACHGSRSARSAPLTSAIASTPGCGAGAGHRDGAGFTAIRVCRFGAG